MGFPSWDTRGRTIVVAASNSIDPNLTTPGYRCDGTNDQVEINAAITALGVVGGTVILLEGTYNITASINLATLTTLMGQGAGTVLRIPNGHDADLNVISGSSVNRVLVANLKIDGNRANQAAGTMHGIYFTTVTHSKIVNCWVENMYGGDGIYLRDYSSNNIIAGNNSRSNGILGIALIDSSNSMIISNNCQSNLDGGIMISDCLNDIVANNNVQSNEVDGILIITVITPSQNNIISDNNVQNNGEVGIYLSSSHNNTVTDNNLQSNGWTGISILSSNNNTITSNNVVGNSQYADNTYDGIAASNSDYNNIHGNTVRHLGGANQHRYGINIAAANCDGNLVINNDLYLSGKTASFNDAGTGTKLATKTLQFQHGGDATGIIIAQFISADASAKGWEIDAADEWAVALGQLPLELQQVVRIKVWAVALVAEADKMRLDINANAGASDEPYTTEAIAVANKPSVTGNFAADDVIYWMIDPSDDSDIGDLAGGDSLEVKVKHAAAGNGDCETDAVFRCVEIEYV